MVKKLNGDTISTTVITKLIFISLIVFSAALYSCKKDDISSYSAPEVFPKDKGAAAYGTTTDLKWSANPGATKYNVYFGENDKPVIYKSNLSAQTVSVPVVPGHEYYWRVGTIDGSGTEMMSPLYTFKVKMHLNLDAFTGAFKCTEPKYSSYNVNASKLGTDTIQVDNFWDMKWTIKYVFDELGNVKIVPKTFSPDPSLTYFVTGAGTYDNETNEFRVNYTVLQKLQGHPPVSTEVDENMHVFTKR